MIAWRLCGGDDPSRWLLHILRRIKNPCTYVIYSPECGWEAHRERMMIRGINHRRVISRAVCRLFPFRIGGGVGGGTWRVLINRSRAVWNCPWIMWFLGQLNASLSVDFVKWPVYLWFFRRDTQDLIWKHQILDSTSYSQRKFSKRLWFAFPLESILLVVVV